MTATTDKPERALPAPLIDAVFGGQRTSHTGWHALAWIGAFGLHAALWMLAQLSGPSLETWSARIAAMVHNDLNANAPTAIESWKPPEPPPPAPAPTAAPARAEPTAPPRAAAATPARAPAPPPPAASAQIIAADADAPVDLTSDTFVTGSASAYAGGVTTSTGTSSTPVSRGAMAAPGSAPPTASDAAVQPVSLTSEQWQCPWPEAALAQDLYEQFVIVRAWVRADGSVERTSVVSDPGYGFGAAAMACALRTHFNPAHNVRGEAVRALSPPIRVRFTR